jgi:ATP-dependent Clp protease adaptor protein ClpS
MKFETEILEPISEEKVLAKNVQKDLRDLILYNDDHNTFHHVISCLMKICQHDMIQAEQSAHIVHNNGKCGIKRGTFEKLKPMCEALLEEGLSAKIN